jgi:hypothetical protein
VDCRSNSDVSATKQMFYCFSPEVYLLSESSLECRRDSSPVFVGLDNFKATLRITEDLQLPSHHLHGNFCRGGLLRQSILLPSLKYPRPVYSAFAQATAWENLLNPVINSRYLNDIKSVG